MSNIKLKTSKIDTISSNSIKKIGVLGSGLMGHGIAYITALAKIEVVLVDINQKIADTGMNRIKAILKNDLEKGIIKQSELESIQNRIIATDDYSKLDYCDIIIEAVFEDSELKGKVTRMAEAHLTQNGIFASNTSTIPITILSENSSKAENFIGLHFFSPVNKMKLVEIIKSEKTSSYTLNKSYEFVKKIKKIPIVVNDNPGFYTTRVFEKYVCEGMALLYEGVKASTIEECGKKAGFPVGPLAVIDEINIQLLQKIRVQTIKYLNNNGKKIELGSWDIVLEMMTDKLNRTGRTGKGGFYQYPKSGKKYLWPDIEKHFPVSSNQIPEDDIIDRIYFSQAIEAVDCYEGNIICSVSDANTGSIYGWGFPKTTGGILNFVNNYGITDFRDRANYLSKNYGSRFSPPSLIQKMSKLGKTF